MKSKGRTTSSYHDRVRPVERIELREDKSNLRLILFCVFLAIAVISLGFTFVSLLREEPGWRDIEVSSSAEMSCASELIFRYELGRSGNATAEYKAISAIYTEACVKCHRLFNNDESYADTVNIRHINLHPNEELQLDALLYSALEAAVKQGGSYLYLAPVYRDYQDMFYSGSDLEAEYYDPFKNSEAADYYAAVCRFANDRQQVELRLLGDNKVLLHVSEEYLSFAEENFIQGYIDLFWMKNAFIVDYIADTLTSAGYTRGSITSYDGFVRNMDGDASMSYSFNLFDRKGKNINQAAILEYSGPMSIVYLRDYKMNSLDVQHYYERGDGVSLSCYIDPEDGLCRAALPNLVGVAADKGCGELLLGMLEAYIAESFDETKLHEGAEYIWFEGYELCRSSEELNIFALFERDNVKYTLSE